MPILSRSAALRRYTFRILAAMTLYAAALLPTVHSFRHGHPSRVTALALSILPSIPILAVILTVALYLREERDEFQRDLTVQALLWAMGGTLATTSVWGFMEMFHQAPHVPAFYVFILFWLFVGVAGWGLRLAYRTPRND